MAKKKLPEPVVESLAVAVPPERAWEALTSARVMGDIVMGHVEMDTRPGHSFVWDWGVWAKCAPGRADYAWRGTILDSVPGSTLVLSGGPMTAVFTVKGARDSSLITVVQPSIPPRTKIEDFQHGWADFLLKLKTLLERPAHAENTYWRALVRAKPAEILRAWLSPTAVSKILPGKAKIQAKPGGRFEWRWKHPEGAVDSGTLLEIVKGHRVSATWESTKPPSEVRFAAEQTPYGALVSLEHMGVHHDLLAGPERGSYGRMWSHLLERLRVYFFYGKKIRAS